MKPLSDQIARVCEYDASNKLHSHKFCVLAHCIGLSTFTCVGDITGLQYVASAKATVACIISCAPCSDNTPPAAHRDAT